MPNHQHKYLHRRTPEPNVWDEFLEGAADLNPFGETTKELQAKEAKGPSTVYATVYTTLEPTFSGDVGGYSTVGSDSDTTTAAAAEPTTSAEQADATSNAKATTSESDDTSLPESVVPTATADLGSESTLAVATKTSSTSSESTAIGTGATVSAAIAAASSSSTAASTSSSSSEDGSSSGAKAGIAFGVLGGLLVFGLLAWFLFNKRRKQMEQQQANDNEKINRDMRAAAIPNRRSSVMTTRTTATAPRLSLRPVTQFMPNFGERRSSRGAAMALAIAPSSSNNNPSARRPVGNGQYDRPATSQSSHQENPFGNNAERLDAVSERSVSVVGLDVHPNNPFDAPENVMAQTTNYHPDSSINSAAAAGAGVIAGAAVGTALTRKQSTRQNAPQALDFTTANQPLTAFGPVPVPASPAGTEFSMTEVDPGQSPGPSSSAAAIAAAGGPPQSTVHRVQLDFKPSMDDEIGLKAGQLVRLLHAYDDGWALCIRLDRSHQGVCPRTCLSVRPVKPRPAGPPGTRNGPPINPNGSRGPPHGPPRGPPRGPGPNFPQDQRPMTPQGRPQPRPESPAMRPMGPGARPQSPAMMGTQSPSGMAGSQPPAGMSRPQSPGPRGPYNGRPQSPGPRAMSPGPRAQSPGPRQRAHSQSNASGPRNSPPGPSPMNPASGNSPPQERGPPQGTIGRKPVPGQAY